MNEGQNHRQKSAWRRFLNRPPGYKRLLAEAFVLAGLIRFVIRFLPFRVLIRLIGAREKELRNETDTIHFSVAEESALSAAEPLTRDISSSVKSVSRHVPWQSKCLDQASAAKMMMNRRGIPSRLYLGVSKSGLKGNGEEENRKIRSHAWLVADNVVVLGGDNLDDYVAVSEY